MLRLLQGDVGSGKTILALNLIAKLCKKTLVIVHKEFLINQWKENLNLTNYERTKFKDILNQLDFQF